MTDYDNKRQSIQEMLDMGVISQEEYAVELERIEKEQIAEEEEVKKKEEERRIAEEEKKRKEEERKAEEIERVRAEEVKRQEEEKLQKKKQEAKKRQTILVLVGGLLILIVQGLLQYNSHQESWTNCSSKDTLQYVECELQWEDNEPFASKVIEFLDGHGWDTCNRDRCPSLKKKLEKDDLCDNSLGHQYMSLCN